MIVTKKNGKICVCVDLKKVNVATIRDPYPLLLQSMYLKETHDMKLIVFLMGSLDTTKCQLIVKINIKQHLPPHGECLHIKRCHLI